MKWLSKFWKIRRRHGSVKVAILLFLAALYFIGQSIFAVWTYMEFAEQNVEYILGVSNPEGVQSSDLKKLEKLDDVCAVTMQRVYSITYKYGAEAKMLPVTEVSPEYLQSAFGIDSASSGAGFYLNQSAWDEMIKGNMTVDGSMKSLSVPYSEDETLSKTAQFVLNDALKNDSPMAFAAGNSVSFAGCTNIRLMTEKTDISGMTLENLRMLGYMVENEQEILEGTHELEIVMLKLKYGLIIAVLAFSLGAVLVKDAYRRVDS